MYIHQATRLFKNLLSCTRYVYSVLCKNGQVPCQPKFYNFFLTHTHTPLEVASCPSVDIIKK